MGCLGVPLGCNLLNELDWRNPLGTAKLHNLSLFFSGVANSERQGCHLFVRGLFLNRACVEDFLRFGPRITLDLSKGLVPRHCCDLVQGASRFR